VAKLDFTPSKGVKNAVFWTFPTGCYLAGSLNWRTGDLILTEGDKGQGRNSALFIRHLDDLRRRLRCYRKIHVICDNASFHNGRAVRSYLAEHDDRIVIHFLPKYAPDLNPIERNACLQSKAA